MFSDLTNAGRKRLFGMRGGGDPTGSKDNCNLMWAYEKMAPLLIYDLCKQFLNEFLVSDCWFLVTYGPTQSRLDHKAGFGLRHDYLVSDELLLQPQAVGSLPAPGWWRLKWQTWGFRWSSSGWWTVGLHLFLTHNKINCCRNHLKNIFLTGKIHTNILSSQNYKVWRKCDII